MKYYVMIIFTILFETYDYYYSIGRVRLLSCDYILLKNIQCSDLLGTLLFIELDILVRIALFELYEIQSL